MGKSHALALAAQGAKVAITDVNAKDCLPVAEEIKSKGGEAICFQMDVSNKTEVDQVFDEVVKQFGRLDILVNNAGIYFPKTALELTEKDWDKMIDINLKGQFLCAQRAAKEMAKNKWGRIINISSVASGQVGVGILGGAHYTASKGGVIGLSETLAVEWAPLGINVNVIAPGPVDTPLLRKAFNNDLKTIEEYRRMALRGIASCDEIATMIVFMASDACNFMNGAIVPFDGGESILYAGEPPK